MAGGVRRIVILVVRIVPEPQVRVVLVWFLGTWLAEAVSCFHQAVDDSRLITTGKDFFRVNLTLQGSVWRKRLHYTLIQLVF